MSGEQPGVVQLPAAGVPADGGLSTLGLVMQVAGTISGIGVSLFAFSTLFAMRVASPDTLWMFVLLATCVVRSLFHRFAGTELLYGRPVAGLLRYILIGLAHSVLFAVAMKLSFGATTTFAVGFGLGLAAWPALLGCLVLMGQFKRFPSSAPMAEDKGFEGAAILMTILGLCGALMAAMMLLAMVEAGGRAMREGRMVLMMLAVVMLFVRSVLHVHAGVSGLRTTLFNPPGGAAVDRSVELANRYSSFGIVSAFCAGGAMLLAVMTSSIDVLMVAAVSGVTWMLMAWPMIVRRFFGDRQFNDLLAGERADVHRRAPDAGLTGLGWLLIAHAAYGLTFLIPGMVADDMPHEMMRLFDLFAGSDRSPWWDAAIAMLELWAGYELIQMSRYHRVIASIYAVVASVVTIYMFWPTLEALGSLRFTKPQHLLALMPIAISLVIPASVLVLVNRKIAPTARARFKSKA
jgi:hypothetical protein